jgi:hypothetical protein
MGARMNRRITTSQGDRGWPPGRGEPAVPNPRRSVSGGCRGLVRGEFWCRVAVAVAAVVAVCLSGCTRAPQITVTSDPPGAAVWVDGDLRGPAPQTLEVPRGDAGLALRVVLPGYADGEAVLRRGALPADGRLVMKLVARRSHTLQCLSRPAGAEVLLDGEVRGQTPLTIVGVDSDSCELLFRAPARESVSRTVELSGSTDPVVVEVTLKSLGEGYYLARIREAPEALPNYVDLAHLYALEKRFDAAAQVLEKGAILCLSGRLADESPAYRLWSEIERIVTMQFEYGSPEDLQTARLKMRKMLDGLLGRFPSGSPALFEQYTLVLAELGESKKARAALDEGLRRYPDSKELQRLQKRLGKQSSR